VATGCGRAGAGEHVDVGGVHRLAAFGAAQLGEIEERPGGAYRIWQADGGVIVGSFDSQLLELVPGRRLVFRWGFIGPRRRAGPSFETLLTVSFDSGPSGGTMLTLVHERSKDSSANETQPTNNATGLGGMGSPSQAVR